MFLFLCWFLRVYYVPNYFCIFCRRLRKQGPVSASKSPQNNVGFCVWHQPDLEHQKPFCHASPLAKGRKKRNLLFTVFLTFDCFFMHSGGISCFIWFASTFPTTTCESICFLLTNICNWGQERISELVCYLLRSRCRPSNWRNTIFLFRLYIAITVRLQMRVAATCFLFPHNPFPSPSTKY